MFNFECIIRRYGLSLEFENCLKNIIDNSSNKIFSDLSKLHFHLNGGKDNEISEKVFFILELLIILTDILDDIEDNDIDKWKEHKSILVNATTALISIIVLELNSLNKGGKINLVNLFFNYLLDATDGQYRDLMNNSDSEKEIIDYMIKKSGSLIALSSILGEVLAKGSYSEKIIQASYYMSVIAQLNNDYEDLLKNQKDIHNKKITLPIFYLLKYSTSELDTLRDYYSNLIENVPKVNLEANDWGLNVYIMFLKAKYRQHTLNILNEIYSENVVYEFKKFLL